MTQIAVLMGIKCWMQELLYSLVLKIKMGERNYSVTLIGDCGPRLEVEILCIGLGQRLLQNTECLS